MTANTSASRVLAIAAIIAAAAAVPTIGSAQGTITIGSESGGGVIMKASGDAAKKKDEVKKVSADSVKALKKFAKEKQPLVVIDDSVSTIKAFEALTFEEIVRIQFDKKEADVKHYGDKAKNGVILLKTNKSVKDESTVREIKFGGEGGGSFKFDMKDLKIEQK